MSYVGTHDGSKKGKKFQEPGNPNKKAQAKLAMRQKAYDKDIGRFGSSNNFSSRTKPGSLNVRNH